MLPGYDQHVAAPHRLDIQERQDLFILVNDVGGNLLPGDPAEQAVFRHGAGLGGDGAVRGADKIPYWRLGRPLPGAIMSRDDDMVMVSSTAADLLLAQRIAHVLVEEGLACGENRAALVPLLCRQD